MMRQYLITGAVVLAMVLTTLACSISGNVDVEGPQATSETGARETPTSAPVETEPPATAEPTATPAGESPAAATETPLPEGSESVEPTAPPPTEETEPPVEGEPLEGAEIPELEVPSLDPHGAGLGHLGTFRQRMTVDFAAEGAKSPGSYQYDAEVNTEDQAVHITVSLQGPVVDELPANTIQAIWIGTRLWVKLGNQPWMPIPESVEAPPFDEQMFAVGNFLPYVEQFDRVEPDEQVNGIPCAHYTYDVHNAETEYGNVSGRGDVYVALDGGYVVRYTLDGTATYEEQFQGSGAVSIVYDTYDVGTNVDISPPTRF